MTAEKLAKISGQIAKIPERWLDFRLAKIISRRWGRSLENEKLKKKRFLKLQENVFPSGWYAF